MSLKKLQRAHSKMCSAGLVTISQPIDVQFPELHKSYGWRQYLPDEFKKIWHHLTPSQQYLLVYQAEQRLAASGA